MVTKLYDGTGSPPPEQTILRAGMLSAVYEAGMLRYIRLGEYELMRGIYAAVRDQNWATIPGILENIHIDSESDHFQITFTSVHHQDDIHFKWQGEIVGFSDNRIQFTFDGQALTDFKRNRIGFCVLHPASAAGKSLKIQHVDSSVEQGLFPSSISPNQPFIDIRSITHEPDSGIRAQVLMEGDTFEMEDQRNWSDASYKTYCTPLGQPKPVLVTAGTRIKQTITLSLVGDVSAIINPPTELRLRVDPAQTTPLPKIGLCSALEEQLTTLQIERLRALHLDHLRVDTEIDNHLDQRLRQAWIDAQALGVSIELAVHFGANLTVDVIRLRQTAEAIQFRGKLLLFQNGEKITTVEVIEKVRQAFKGYPHHLELGGGTNIYFTELNRFRPPVKLLESIAFSVNPQVHTFDNASLIETLPTLTTILNSVREFAPHNPIHVTPITLKMRFNPEAVASDESPNPNQLPPQVDLRQMSLFGAGWTLGTLAYLGTANSLTYFQTVGWTGVMEREQGALLPDTFPSIPNSVYPMYHVFADISEFAGGEMIHCVSSDPLQFNGLVLQQGDKRKIMLANHTAQVLKVTISGLKGDFSLKSLDETTADAAIRTPEHYRKLSGQRITGNGNLLIELLPYAVVTLDQHS